MTYEFTISIGIPEFKRILSWGNSDRKFDKDDKKLASKLEIILEDMILEEKIGKEAMDE